MTGERDAGYRRDLEEVFDRDWIALARADQLAEPGSYLTRTIGTEPVVLLRNGTGELRAHLNVCRHRGSQILRGCGQAKGLKCPYHGWMYSLDGELRGAPEMKHSAGFEKADYGLIGLAVAEWRGFAFVSFVRDASLPVERMEREAGAAVERLDALPTSEAVAWEAPLGWRDAVARMRDEAPGAAWRVTPNLLLAPAADGIAWAAALPLEAERTQVLAGRCGGAGEALADLRRSLDAVVIGSGR